MQTNLSSDENWVVELGNELHNSSDWLEIAIANDLHLAAMVLQPPTVTISGEVVDYHIAGAVEKIGLILSAANSPSDDPSTLYWLASARATSVTGGLRSAARKVGFNFIMRFIRELRGAICSGKGEYANLRQEGKAYPKAVATAIATGLLARFGFKEPVAMGVATLILLVLATALRNTCCDMTDEDVLKELLGIEWKMDAKNMLTQLGQSSATQESWTLVLDNADTTLETHPDKDHANPHLPADKEVSIKGSATRKRIADRLRTLKKQKRRKSGSDPSPNG